MTREVGIRTRTNKWGVDDIKESSKEMAVTPKKERTRQKNQCGILRKTKKRG